MNWWELNFKQKDDGSGPAYQECEAQITQIVGNKFKGNYGYHQDIMVMCSDGQTSKQKFYYQGLDEETIKFLGPDDVEPGKTLQLQCKVSPSDKWCNYQEKKFTFRFPGSAKSSGGGSGSSYSGSKSSYRSDTPEQVFGKILTQLTGHACERKPSMQIYNDIDQEWTGLKLLSSMIMLAAKEHGVSAQKPAEDSQPPI